MPEGHVIHALARDLNAAFAGEQVHVSSPQGRFAPEALLLDARSFLHADARGKHLFLYFDSPHIIHIHLGLIGKFKIHPLAEPQGIVRLRINDERTAADLHGPQWCRLIEDADPILASLGNDPITGQLDEAILAKAMRSTRSVGSLLMDQKLFAGVGNIYRAEVLFRHNISPFTEGRSLTRAQWLLIWEDLVDLMRHGTDTGRLDTVYPEHMPEAMNRPPRKDDHGGEVYVYRRAGLPCYICATPIAETQMEGRNLFYCPHCQPQGRRRR
ncbi:MAG: DNA-formamidopyrimidine glycosylase family protein [Corynebacterium sp.]|nr:DNA-formamidopyrimidine glycosylase family protein [Corynebacterium sp.]